jgi:hypothetical protein
MTNTNFGARSAVGRAAPLVLFTLGYLNMPTFWARRLYVTTWWLSILGILALGFTQDPPGLDGARVIGLTERLNWFPLPAIFFGLAAWAVVSLVRELRRSKYEYAVRTLVNEEFDEQKSEAAPAPAPASAPVPATSKLIIPSYIGAGKRVRRGGVTLGGTKINDRRGRDPRDIL